MLANLKQKFTNQKATKSKNKTLTNKEYELLGRSIWQVYVTGYASKGRLMYMSLLRGIAYGVGIFIGGTIVVGIIVTIMLQFEKYPIIGPIVQKINNSIESSKQINNTN
jgi:hypothetical protein